MLRCAPSPSSVHQVATYATPRSPQLAGLLSPCHYPVSEPEWSAAHRGLCLYANRLLVPVAEQPVVQPMKSGKLLKPTFTPDVLQVCMRAKWP